MVDLYNGWWVYWKTVWSSYVGSQRKSLPSTLDECLVSDWAKHLWVQSNLFKPSIKMSLWSFWTYWSKVKYAPLFLFAFHPIPYCWKMICEKRRHHLDFVIKNSTSKLWPIKCSHILRSAPLSDVKGIIAVWNLTGYTETNAVLV